MTAFYVRQLGAIIPSLSVSLTQHYGLVPLTQTCCYWVTVGKIECKIVLICEYIFLIKMKNEDTFLFSRVNKNVHTNFMYVVNEVVRNLTWLTSHVANWIIAVM